MSDQRTEMAIDFMVALLRNPGFMTMPMDGAKGMSKFVVQLTDSLINELVNPEDESE